MAGVNIIQDGGTPGGGFQIKIRGRNSIRLDEMNHYILLMEFLFKRVHRKCEHFNGITKPSQSAQQY
jgi:hypothetical protein